MKKILIVFIISFTLFACAKDDSVTPVLDPLVVAEFKPNLSDLNIYLGDLNELNVSSRIVEYSLSTPLFTDYSHKQRLIALPENISMQYNGDGLPIFPDNTVIAKTFYYNLDERDLTLGKQIIETRLLIKIEGTWETGNYKWNESQTEAVLDLTPNTIPVTWIDEEGQSNSISYKIPSDNQCFTCHKDGEDRKPLGIKLRTLNISYNGTNQLQNLIDLQLLDGLQNVSNVSTLPKWNDAFNYSLEERARAYLDINCAHCHTEGGYCEVQSPLRLDYETSFADSKILIQKNHIYGRISSDFQLGFTMPWIGTTILHDEGVDLILEYLDTL